MRLPLKVSMMWFSGEGFDEGGEKIYLPGVAKPYAGASWKLDGDAFRLDSGSGSELGDYELLIVPRRAAFAIFAPPLGYPTGEGGILQSAVLGERGSAHAARLVGGEDFNLILLGIALPPGSVALDDGALISGHVSKQGEN